MVRLRAGVHRPADRPRDGRGCPGHDSRPGDRADHTGPSTPCSHTSSHRVSLLPSILLGLRADLVPRLESRFDHLVRDSLMCDHAATRGAHRVGELRGPAIFPYQERRGAVGGESLRHEHNILRVHQIQDLALKLVEWLDRKSVV